MEDNGTLIEFLQERKRTAQEGTVDRTAVVAEWVQDLEGLMTKIIAWLEEARKEELVIIDKDTELLSEDSLGSYTVPKLTLDFQNVVVEIVPAFRLTVGAQGRVDFICGARKALLLRPSQGNWSFAGYPDKLKTVPLDEEVFHAAIRNLLA